MTSALSPEIDNSQTVDLSRVRVVLVNTSHPGNIGAVARAMKNMGLQQLSLVQPAEFPSAEATARASGADDILATAQVVESLEDAIAECALVVGASARLRTISWPTLDPKACAERMIDVSWDVDYAGSFFAWVQVEALDRPKLLRDVTEIISDHGGNIQAASSATGRDRVAILRFEVQLSDPQQLERVIAEARRVDGVFDAYRLVPQGSG